MASIAKLVVSLGANTASFETDMKRASRNQAARMKKMKQDAAVMAKGLAVAFTAAAGAMTAVVASTTRTADEMQKLALRTGLTTEALSQYRHAAELSGLSFEQFTNGLKRMSRSISDANVGLSTQTRAFERLGINVDELLQMKPDRQFETIAQAMTGLESATLRSATAQEIFGRSGTEMLSLMAYGREGIIRMRDEADRLGVTIGQGLADSSAMFNDNMTRMAALTKGVGIQFTSGLLPSLVETQQYFLNNAEATDRFSSSGEWLGDVIKRLIAAFIVMKGILVAMGKVLVGLSTAIYNSFKALFLAVKRPIDQLAKALDALTRGDLKAAAQAMKEIPSAMAEGWKEGADAAVRSLEFIGTGLDDVQASIDDAFELLNTRAEESERPLYEVEESLYDVADAATEAGNQIEFIGKDAAQGIQRTLPLAIDRTADSINEMNTMLDESIRILTRSLNDVWTDMASGAEDAFDSIIGGFKSMINNLAQQAIVQPIALQFQTAFGPGGEGWSSINWKELGQNVATFAAVIAGTEIGGGGQYAQAGASTGAAIGSLFGPWWAAIGGLAGGFAGGAADEGNFWTESDGSFIKATLGDWAVDLLDFMGGGIGYLFGGATNIGDTILRKLLGVERPAVAKFGTQIGKSKSDTDSVFRTAFGDVLLSTRRLDASQISEISSAIEEFDNSIAALLDGNTIAAITKDLEAWGMKLEGAEITLENILGSRLSVVLDNLSDSIETFVRRGYDTEEQLERLGIALSADKLLGEFASVFPNRTLAEFLDVIESFKTAGGTMQEAFEAVGESLETIISAQAVLREFADTSAIEQYNALLAESGLSLEAAVVGMQSALMDAIAGFDGSPEQLTNIATLAIAAREGELKLLAQIDSIQQGINANLDDLEAKIRGLTEGPKTAEEIFREANALFAQIDGASSSELAALENEFSGLINAIDEADQIALQDSILNMIQGFRDAVNAELGDIRSTSVDNSDSSQELADIFLNDIGDPLDVLANSNVTVAEELGNIDDSIQELGPTIQNAITRGFGGANVNVTLVIDGNRIVNE